jgi:hypothetical protein
MQRDDSAAGLTPAAYQPLRAGRRAVIGWAVLAAPAGRPAFAAAAGRAPRRTVLTAGFDSARMEVRRVAELTTSEVAFELEGPAEAIRIAVGNGTAKPYTLQGVCCCEAGPGDPWSAPPRTAWHFITFGAGVAASAGPKPVTVPGNRVVETGATDVPALLWSDWLPFRTFAAGRPILRLRVLVPSQTLPMNSNGFPERTQDVLPTLPPRLRAVRDLPGDFVTEPLSPALSTRPAFYAPLFAVQYRSALPGIQIVVGGDSQLAQWFSFAQLAGMRLSTPALPVSVWDVARGGAQSKTFWPILETAIEAARPSISVIQGWTASDGDAPVLYENYLAEVRQSVADTRRLGGIPIVFRGMPRKLYGTSRLQGWQRCNDDLERRLPGAAVFDLDRVAEDPVRPGDWRAEFSDDRINPNPAGSLAIADAFEQALRLVL